MAAKIGKNAQSVPEHSHEINMINQVKLTASS
jgi:hypothetical protein